MQEIGAVKKPRRKLPRKRRSKESGRKIAGPDRRIDSDVMVRQKRTILSRLLPLF